MSQSREETCDVLDGEPINLGSSKKQHLRNQQCLAWWHRRRLSRRWDGVLWDDFPGLCDICDT